RQALPALWPPLRTGQNSTLKWPVNQAGSAGVASLRLLFGGVCFLRAWRGVCHRRAPRRPRWRRWRRPKPRPGVEKFAEHFVGLERIATAGDQHIDLIRRQLQPRLDGVERRRPVRAQLIERNAADKEFHVLAIPSRRRAEAAALGLGKVATPTHQAVA